MKIKVNKSLILSFVAAGGVIATGIFIGFETPKAIRLLEEEEKKKGEKLTKVETVATASKAYFPAIALGTGTICCIFGIHIFNAKQQASIVAAYTLVNKNFKQYRDALIRLHGEEADKEVRDEVILQNCNYHHIGCDVPDEKIVWYDEISGESIEAYEKEIIDAEYHFNRNFVMRGYASLNEFYEFLGIPQTEYGDSVGWTCSDGYCWVDFEHRIVSNGDDGGTYVYAITPIFEPSADYMSEWS